MAAPIQTNQEYYAGEKVFYLPDPLTTYTEFVSTFEVALVTDSPSGIGNFRVESSTDGGTTWTEYTNALTVVNNDTTTPPWYTNTVTLAVGIVGSVNTLVRVKLKAEALWDNYGSYEYIKLNDVINNFLIAYVGADKLIPSVKRTDVIFHAKRGLQEFSYDTLPSIKIQEVTMPANLSVILPQDYVNYVRLSYVDSNGVLHPIKPANTITTDPTQVPIQDDQGNYLQDNFGENLQAGQSLTQEDWKSNSARNISGAYQDYAWAANTYNWSWRKNSFGQRYGLDPVTSQSNGWFSIDRRHNRFAFSSNLKDKLIIIEYISDGLSSDEDSKIPKMAEEAIYMHIAYSLLASRANVPEYLVSRFKRDRYTSLRNAKIRLSNMKLGEMIQVMRGQSKWIKH